MKLTKGQKNELIRQQWGQREKAINKLGYSIKSRKCGYGELDVSIHKDGVNLFPGLSWDYESSAIIYVEELIKKEQLLTSEDWLTSEDYRND